MATIPYSLLCADTMSTEVIEPTLVRLVGTWALFYFVQLIIRDLSIKCSIFRFIHFCYVIISNKKEFLGRVLLISLSGHVT